jgi:hypothetical protein
MVVLVGYIGGFAWLGVDRIDANKDINRYNELGFFIILDTLV